MQGRRENSHFRRGGLGGWGWTGVFFSFGVHCQKGLRETNSQIIFDKTYS